MDVNTLTTWLAIANVMDGIGYYLASMALVLAPILIPWLRRLGKWGLAFLILFVGFLVSCANHHFLFSSHTQSTHEILHDPTALLNFLLWDSLQPIFAIGWTLVLVYKGKWFVRQLRAVARENPAHSDPSTPS